MRAPHADLPHVQRIPPHEPQSCLDVPQPTQLRRGQPERPLGTVSEHEHHVALIVYGLYELSVTLPVKPSAHAGRPHSWRRRTLREYDPGGNR
jgi:hypothetical protein